jgi:hypothetical protein
VTAVPKSGGLPCRWDRASSDVGRLLLCAQHYFNCAARSDTRPLAGGPCSCVGESRSWGRLAASEAAGLSPVAGLGHDAVQCAFASSRGALQANGSPSGLAWPRHDGEAARRSTVDAAGARRPGGGSSDAWLTRRGAVVE